MQLKGATRRHDTKQVRFWFCLVSLISSWSFTGNSWVCLPLLSSIPTPAQIGSDRCQREFSVYSSTFGIHISTLLSEKKKTHFICQVFRNEINLFFIGLKFFNLLSFEVQRSTTSFHQSADWINGGSPLINAFISSFYFCAYDISRLSLKVWHDTVSLHYPNLWYASSRGRLGAKTKEEAGSKLFIRL